MTKPNTRQRAIVFKSCKDHKCPDPTLLNDFTLPLVSHIFSCSCQIFICSVFDEEDDVVQPASLCLFADGSQWIRWPEGTTP